MSRPDLDPEDRLARMRLAADLRKLRIEQGLNRVQLSTDLGMARTAVSSMERGTSWAVRKVQGWARPLGHRFTMTVRGLVVPDADHGVDIPAFGDADEDLLHLRAVIDGLIRVRLAAGLSREDMASRMWVTPACVAKLEENPDEALLRMVQRYARGLDGSLGLNLERLPAALVAS